MTKAIVFPGQGSQKIGMGKALYDAFPEAKAVFDEVDEALQQKLSRLIFEGTEEDLKLTENAQPALMAMSMAVVAVLEKAGFDLEEKVSFLAGHSLGEYAAYAAAGSFSLADAARLLKKRGVAMQMAVPIGLGGMAAVMGADWEVAAEIAKAACAGDEICSAANDNAPGQIVISGHMAAIDRAIQIAAERGLRRCLKLPVSAPFHCALMQPAADVMRDALAAVSVKMPRVPVVTNVTARPVKDADAIRELLVQQITGMVRWRESVLFMKEQGVSQIVECGSGTVLCGLIKRIDKEIQTVALQTPEEIDAFLKTL